MKILNLCFLFFLLSCEILPEEPTQTVSPVYSGPPLLSFTYDNSPNFPGYIRFYNTSKGIVTFAWDFGILDSQGKPITSKGVSPRIEFPRNGTYAVQLSGVGSDEKLYTTRQTIEVTNR